MMSLQVFATYRGTLMYIYTFKVLENIFLSLLTRSKQPIENLHCELFKKKIIVQNAEGDLGQGGSGLDPSSGLPPLLLS